MENPSLGETIQNAIHEYLAINGGGFITSFVMAVDYVDSDGDSRLLVSELPGQRARHSLGLIAELDELFRMEVCEGWMASRARSEDDG